MKKHWNLVVIPAYPRIVTKSLEIVLIASVPLQTTNAWMILANSIFVMKTALALLLKLVTNVNVKTMLALINIAVQRRRKFVPVIGGVGQSAVLVNATFHKVSMSLAQ